MTIGTFLEQSTKVLTQAGIITARLDCLVLLEDMLQTDRAVILAHTEDDLNNVNERALSAQIIARASHTPLAYIRGKAAFYGRDFIVNASVLVPRPETEDILNILLSLPGISKASIADIGTGSGCIGLTAALELPESHVDLYDIDADALEVAQANATHLGASVHIHISDLLADIKDNPDILLANLPYVPDAFPVNEAARQEPKLALYSGADGLDHYRTFWMQVAQLPHQPQHILTEALPSQHHALALLARNSGYVQEEKRGYVQRFSL